MIELSELNSYQEASLFCSDLSEWQEGPQVLTYGAILLCRRGRAVLNVNYKDWDLYEGAVITLFPNDVVEVKNGETLSLSVLSTLRYTYKGSWTFLCQMSFGQPYRYPHYPCFPSPCGKLPTPIACLLQKVLPRSLFHPQFLKLDFKSG